MNLNSIITIITIIIIYPILHHSSSIIIHHPPPITHHPSPIIIPEFAAIAWSKSQPIGMIVMQNYPLLVATVRICKHITIVITVSYTVLPSSCDDPWIAVVVVIVFRAKVSVRQLIGQKTYHPSMSSTCNPFHQHLHYYPLKLQSRALPIRQF